MAAEERRMKPGIAVGSLVRTRRSKDGKINSRAIVQTIEDDGSLSILLESEHPRPLDQISVDSKRFLITPNLDSKSNEDEIELIVSSEEVVGLLPFESDLSFGSDERSAVAIWKDRGDQLLRLGDAASAIPYYEAALRACNKIEIGSSILIKKDGRLCVAEVDCIDDQELDIAIPSTGEEQCITASSVIMSILESDTEHLQGRTLLNLTRCLLHLTNISELSEFRPKYFQAAVLATTVAISLAEHNNQDEGNSQSTSTPPASALTAMILRAKAQSGLLKFNHAMQDARKLIAFGNEEGKRLFDDIERQQRKHVKTNKKLAKDVARWVDQATSQSVSEDEAPQEEEEEEERPLLAEDENEQCNMDDDETQDESNDISRMMMASLSWLTLLLPVIVAYAMHKAVM